MKNEAASRNGRYFCDQCKAMAADTGFRWRNTKHRGSKAQGQVMAAFGD
jgi:hypothetical protein